MVSYGWIMECGGLIWLVSDKYIIGEVSKHDCHPLSWFDASPIPHHPRMISCHLISCLSHTSPYFFSGNHDSMSHLILFIIFTTLKHPTATFSKVKNDISANIAEIVDASSMPSLWHWCCRAAWTMPMVHTAPLPPL